jgi:hypothetical protein
MHARADRSAQPRRVYLRDPSGVVFDVIQRDATG